ncbi:hypothetical protein HELRODRAFT_166469 [Helobdella robusta]|uniref:Uncharacterized protein n=1 Tax=Helobdella robusta TaxID=6412 RepID=T1EY60_HELRO|nr:hypothetical protein HELRODRAFT_166469 [Helobdella robusta]ESO11479.1 hypothetical protein HELRODRAFT_166469 [Helobdella robusta]
MKSDKLLECIWLMRYLKDNNLWNNCPIFVSAKLDKIPKSENFLMINFGKISCEIMSTLSKQQLLLDKAIETTAANTFEINLLKSKFNLNNECKVVEREKTQQTALNNINLKDENKNVDFERTQQAILNKPLWSEILKSPRTENEESFTTANHNKPRSFIFGNNTKDGGNMPLLAATKYDVPTKKPRVKIIGKKVFCLSNIKSYHKNDVVDYLSSNGINVISCFPVQKSVNKNSSVSANSNEGDNLNNHKSVENREEKEATTFRVCIASSDAEKIKDPEIMPEHVIVREWQFDKKREIFREKTNLNEKNLYSIGFCQNISN